MDMVERAMRSLQQLNEALRSEGDTACARYVSVEPDSVRIVVGSTVFEVTDGAVRINGNVVQTA